MSSTRSLPSQIGDYEPLLQLASGGMASVYVARKAGPAGFERLVALKRVHAHLVDDREFCDLFRDEAKLASLVHHANVVPVIDVVEAPHELLLVQEYVESLSLATLATASDTSGAARARAVPPALAVRVMLDALAGLHAAHELVDLRGQRLEVVHRDVSPQNVIVGTDGVARLIDFGIAKAATTAAGTSSGVLRGKLSYMSPEQINRRPLDRRSDLFAAGVVLHELLTGRRLFSGDDQGDVALSILLGEVVRVSDIAPDVPRALDDVVARALERDVDRRWATAAEFQEALESALAPASARDVARWVIERGGDRIERRREQLRAALDASARAAPVVEAQTQSQQRRAPPWVIGAVAAGALLVAAGAAAKVARSARSTAGGAGEDGAAAAPATAVTGEAASANAGAGDTAGGDAGAPGEGVGAGVHRRHRGPRAAPSEPGLHRNPYGAP